MLFIDDFSVDNCLVQNGEKVYQRFYRRIFFLSVNSRVNDLFNFTEGYSVSNIDG